MKSKFGQLFFFFVILGIASCDPCDELGNKICECEGSAEEQERCKKELELRKTHPSYKEAKNSEQCLLALKSCSCEALRNNEVEKCGMTRG